MRKMSFPILLAVIALLLFAAPVHAAKYDLSLWRFCDRAANGTCLASSDGLTAIPDNAKFDKFAEQLAAVLSPKYHATADTLGWSGWNVSMEYSYNDIPDDNNCGSATNPKACHYWDDALSGVEHNLDLNPVRNGKRSKATDAPGHLDTVQLHVRKGLPMSFEIGFIGTYIINTEMYLLGIEGKFAFVENIHPYVPDMAIQMNYSHLFGSNDMEMDLFSWDLHISYNWGLGGFIKLAPYAGYSLVYAIAAPRVLNPSFDSNNNGILLKLDQQEPIIHRGFFGLRLIATYVYLAPEVIVTSANVYNYSFNIGADF